MARLIIQKYLEENTVGCDVVAKHVKRVHRKSCAEARGGLGPRNGDM